MKKFAGDIIILHMRTKNHNHMMYSSQIKSETDRIFCHFGPFFALLPPQPHRPPHPPVMILKIKILKKNEKMPRDIILFYINVYHN